MLKSGGVVILMQLNLDNYNELSFLVGNNNIVNQMKKSTPLQPFSDEVVEFLNDLSKEVMSIGKDYSDVATFGFWCRRSAILQEKSKYDDLSNRLGRGITFHIAPSNVPINFAFSLVAGLLSGNTNIVRVPTKEFAQINIVSNTVKELLSEKYPNLIPYICMVRYPSGSQLTEVFSSICDSRVIWGGDATIAEIRKYPLKPRANEITFSDRHSIAVIDSDEYISSANKENIAQDFYNDTYFSDQNACSSPRVIIWLGEKKDAAKSVFWQHLHKLLSDKYTLAPVQSVAKLNMLYKIACHYDVKLIKEKDQLITRIAVKKLDDTLMNFKGNSGFFFEYDADSLNEILPLCNERCQTLTYYGLSKNELENFISAYRPHGIDRAVPIGKSMDFSLVWDGYDLIRSLSRKVLIH